MLHPGLRAQAGRGCYGRMGTTKAKPRPARLVEMTTYSHNVVMRQVRIAELKARLSEYLRAVRRGETIAVFDRETPVAQITPVRERSALRVRKPAPGSPPPNRVRLPKPSRLDVDVVQLLLEERQSHR
jgi:prevent-host-death family protein